MDKPKNLLFITADQQRFDSLPSYGADFVVAPNIERLAAEGVVFDRCYAASPVCVPCRGTMMTGQFPSAHGAIDNFHWIDRDAVKWSEAAVAAGYRTTAIGKMHFAPWDLMEGFQERIICEDKRHFYIPDDHARFLESRGLERLHPKDVPGYFETCGAPDFPYDKDFHPDAYVADQAVEWIDEKGGDPFALWVSFPGPHDPYDPPEEYSRLYEKAPIPEPLPAPVDPGEAPSFSAMMENPPAANNSVFRLDYTGATPDQVMGWRRHYFGNITLIDEGVGKIRAALERAGVLDDTVIVFTSDHGDALGDHGMVFKGFFYESMVHVPLIVWDGKNRGRRKGITGTNDVVGYFADVLGVRRPPDHQGGSIGLLLDDDNATLHDVVFSEMPGRAMAFDGRYKYIQASTGRNELYDLKTDPDEMANLVEAPERVSDVARLREALVGHFLESTRLYGKTREETAYPHRKEMEATYRRELEKRR